MSDRGSGLTVESAESLDIREVVAHWIPRGQMVLEQGTQAEPNDGTIEGVALSIVQSARGQAQCHGVATLVEA